MTRRKKTKSTESQNAPSGLNMPVPASTVTTKATTTFEFRGNTISTPTILQYTPARSMMRLSTTSHSAATSSTPRSSVSSSVISQATSTCSSGLNDKTSKNAIRKKKPMNVKVTYVTEQIHIYPNYPILTVERLPNIENHISMLTESIGRRPRVYQYGKGVRFIPESNDEYRTIQRYLGKIEYAERIAWCSYTVPSGNSLKVNMKVRKVEVLNITEDLQKLNLDHCAKDPRPKHSSQKDIKLSIGECLLKNGKLMTKDFPSKGIELPTKDFSREDNKLSTSSPGLDKSKPTDLVSKDLRLSAANIGRDDKKKKPRDIAQNRSFNRRNI